MKTKRYLFAFLFLFSHPLLAQQRLAYTSYLSNPYLLHPALTGKEEYAHLAAGYRVQGVDTDPVGPFSSGYLSGYTSVGRNSRKPHPFRNRFSMHHALGGIVTTEHTGPVGRNSLMANYALNSRVTGKWRIALGVSIGAQQFTAQGNRLYFPQNATITPIDNSWRPDASVGFWFYNKNAFLGGTLTQLFSSRLHTPLLLSTDGSQNSNTLAPHYFLTTGIKKEFAYKWSVEPSIVVKYANYGHLYADLNCKLVYKYNFWSTLSYRNLDSFAFLIGVLIGKRIELHYMYDFSTAYLPFYTSNSHEIMLALRIWPKIERHSYPFW